jgi:hypothetical protein
VTDCVEVRMRTYNHRGIRGAGGAGRRSGAIAMEFVLSFPLVLILALACIQISHIWLARQVVLYSAYCAARSCLSCHQGEYQAAAQQAAEQVCAWIVKGHNPGETDKVIPGWGPIPDSGAVKRKTRARVVEQSWNIEVTVEHDFALLIPIVGPMMGWSVNPWESNQEWLPQKADMTGNVGSSDLIFLPHIRFRERVVIPKPYVTVCPMDIGKGW